MKWPPEKNIPVRGTFPREHLHYCDGGNLFGSEFGHGNNRRDVGIRFHYKNGWMLTTREVTTGWFGREVEHWTYTLIDYCPFCGLYLYREGYEGEPRKLSAGLYRSIMQSEDVLAGKVPAILKEKDPKGAAPPGCVELNVYSWDEFHHTLAMARATAKALEEAGR